VFIGFAVAVAITETIAAYRPSQAVTLKWPNDVLAGGAKIAGILVEREAEALLIGVGINLVSHPEGLLYPATHLTEIMQAEDLSGPEPLFTGPDTVLAVLANEVDIWISRVLHDGFEPVREAWLERTHHLGKTVSVNQQTGVFTDLGLDGALYLKREDGTELRVHAGDVSFG
jgi:BirA family biotin operon repressor/biotin-[acetyl-CoA-carboxylase] ligase